MSDEASGNVQGEVQQGSWVTGHLQQIIFLGLALAAIIIGLYFRTPLLKYTGFYEPDGYYHYSVIRSAVLHDFVVPNYLGISGWPASTQVLEPKGLYYVTLIPYFFLRFINYYDIMRAIPMFFAILDAIGAYFLSRYLSKDKMLGLLALLLVMINMGNSARTSATIYRGDTFVAPFFMAALICTIEIFRPGTMKRKLALGVIAGFLLSTTAAVWNGAPFCTATYFVLFLLALLFGFVFDRKELVEDAKYMLVAFVVWWLFVNLYMLTQFMANGQAFTGMGFLPLFALMAVGWFVVRYVLGKKESISQYLATPAGRLAVFAVLMVVAVVALDVAIPSFFYDVFVGNGFIVTSNFSATIQELQAPSPTFIWASFNYQAYMTTMSYAIVASSYVSNMRVEFFIVLMLLSAPYFFMRIRDDDAKKLASGSAYMQFGFDAAFLTLLAYMFVTSYLQMSTIRFNSLLSIPLSIFAAYTVYWIAMLAKGFNRYLLYAAVLIIVALVIVILVTDQAYIQGLSQADGIDTAFNSALGWMRNNTPANSVVLTLWPDGSLVEGLANRTSVTDSVGSQNATKANDFAAWIFNSSPDAQFLTSNINGRPDYFLIRATWLLETQGIFVESGLNMSTEQNYGFNQFPTFAVRTNSTAQEYIFSGLGNITEHTILSTANSSHSVQSYLSTGNRISPVENVAFFDMSNGNFSMVKQTAFNFTNNETFLIIYSEIPSPNLPVNITAGAIINPGLANSNMLKLLYFCNNYNCEWNNDIATMRLVYMNADTKIFKITYNGTS